MLSCGSDADVGDFDLGVLLAVTLAHLVTGLVLELLDHDLGALGGTEDLDGHTRLVQAGRGDLVAVDDHDHRKGQRLTDAGLDLVDLDDIAHSNLLLLAASAHNCVHGALTLLGSSTQWLVSVCFGAPATSSWDCSSWAGRAIRADGWVCVSTPRRNFTGWAVAGSKRPLQLRLRAVPGQRLRDPLRLIGTCTNEDPFPESSAPSSPSSDPSGSSELATASSAGQVGPVSTAVSGRSSTRGSGGCSRSTGAASGACPGAAGSTGMSTGSPAGRACVPAPPLGPTSFRGVGGPAGRRAVRRRVLVTTRGPSAPDSGVAASVDADSDRTCCGSGEGPQHVR